MLFKLRSTVGMGSKVKELRLRLYAFLIVVLILGFILLVFTWLNMLVQLVVFLASTACIGAMYA